MIAIKEKSIPISTILWLEWVVKMTRAKTKMMKKALQDLIMEMHRKGEVIEGSKKIMQEVNITPNIITYLQVKDDGRCEQQDLKS